MENIYDYITKETNAYLAPIQLENSAGISSGWSWSMLEHLTRSFLYKNSQFEEENDNRTLRPNKNIILAIMNVSYRTEGFDVKDIELYVNDVHEAYKSMLVRKFHNKWALEQGIDTFIDETVESYADYGGALIRKSEEAKPEVVDLRDIAFCNQKDLIANPFGIRHAFTPATLRQQKKWGLDENGATMGIEDLILLTNKQDEDEIEVFEVHGTMPIEWLEDEPSQKEESEKDVQQIQVVAYYKDDNDTEQGVTLFKHKEPKLPFKLLKRDDIKGRALGRGGIEELFEAQVWTNWNEVKVTEMLEAVSKQLVVTDDTTFAAKHPAGLKNLESMEVLGVGDGKTVKILDNYPRNLTLFNDSMERWSQQAQTLGSAGDPLLGDTPPSGTPFKLFESQTIEGKGIHEYRKGKIATFVDEIYRDWVLPYIQKEVAQDQSFLAELSADEMQEISTQVSENQANKIRNEQVINGELPTDRDELVQEELEGFVKGGNKRFFEIFKDEIKEPLSVLTNIAGKQKNLALMTDKLVNVFRQYLDMRSKGVDTAGLDGLLNTILESSGLSPIMFKPPPMQAPEQPQQQVSTEPLEQLAEAK